MLVHRVGGGGAAAAGVRRDSVGTQHLAPMASGQSDTCSCTALAAAEEPLQKACDGDSVGTPQISAAPMLWQPLSRAKRRTLTQTLKVCFPLGAWARESVSRASAPPDQIEIEEID